MTEETKALIHLARIAASLQRLEWSEWAREGAGSESLSAEDAEFKSTVLISRVDAAIRRLCSSTGPPHWQLAEIRCAIV